MFRSVIAKPEEIGTSRKIPFSLANYGAWACTSIHRILGHRGHVSRWTLTMLSSTNEKSVWPYVNPKHWWWHHVDWGNQVG